MATPEENKAALEAALIKLADEPKQASVDGVNVMNQSINDLIAAARYFSAQKAAKSATGGLRFSKIVPPGAP